MGERDAVLAVKVGARTRTQKSSPFFMCVGRGIEASAENSAPCVPKLLQLPLYTSGWTCPWRIILVQPSSTCIV